MKIDTQTLVQLGVLLPAGMLALGVLYKRGCLSRKSLENRPVRITGLTGIDLVIGMMLIIAGMLLRNIVYGMIKPDPENHMQQAAMQLLMQACSFGPVICFAFFKVNYIECGISHFGLSMHEPTHAKTGIWALILGVPILFALSSLIAVITTLLGINTPEIAHVMLQSIHETRDVTTLVLLLTSAIIVAPLFEEIVFRGFLHQTMRDVISDKTPWVNICVCSAIFAGIHLSAAQWQTLPALFVLGGMLGWIYEKTGSLWPCIILHAGFNILNIAIVLLMM